MAQQRTVVNPPGPDLEGGFRELYRQTHPHPPVAGKHLLTLITQRKHDTL